MRMSYKGHYLEQMANGEIAVYDSVEAWRAMSPSHIAEDEDHAIAYIDGSIYYDETKTWGVERAEFYYTPVANEIIAGIGRSELAEKRYKAVVWDRAEKVRRGEEVIAKHEAQNKLAEEARLMKINRVKNDKRLLAERIARDKILAKQKHDAELLQEKNQRIAKALLEKQNRQYMAITKKESERKAAVLKILPVILRALGQANMESYILSVLTGYNYAQALKIAIYLHMYPDAAEEQIKFGRRLLNEYWTTRGYEKKYGAYIEVLTFNISNIVPLLDWGIEDFNIDTGFLRDTNVFE